MATQIYFSPLSLPLHLYVEYPIAQAVAAARWGAGLPCRAQSAEQQLATRSHAELLQHVVVLLQQEALMLNVE